MRIALPAVLLPFLFACSAAQRPATPDEPSTLAAMLRAHLGLVETPLRPALRLTHRVLREGHPRVAMNWMVVSTPSGETFVHEGGTGGFSSFMGFVPAAGRAAIVLSDTALLARGGLGAIGMRLLEPAP